MVGLYFSNEEELSVNEYRVLRIQQHQEEEEEEKV